MNRHRVTRLAAAFAVLALVGAIPATTLPAMAADAPQSVTTTKTVAREVLAADGTVAATDSRTVTVTADITRDLRSRQVMTLRWAGARPSANIVGNVSDLTAWSGTEYPVVILQCRGDDSSTDPGQRIRPETCWTTSGGSERRLGGTASSGGDIYRHDRYSTPEQKAASIPSAEQWPNICGTGEPAGIESRPRRIVPFVAANGTEYWRCGAEGHGLAPEMGTASALPPNEKVEVTRKDGTGFTHFEVRTAAENASLGCSATVPCAVVVIPIMGITCDDGNARCNQQGLRPEGSQYSDQVARATAVTGQLWASESNWRNRITIPITIAPTDSTCRDTSGRPTLQLYGSVLASAVAEQWSPAYCSRQDRFVLRINDQVEATAFRNLTAGYGSGVVATYRGATGSTVELGYAPIAVTGFAIAFVVDIPEGGGQLESLRLTPRLLAKLLTASYWGTNPSAQEKAQRPDLANNPRSLQLDPEFRELNPALDSDAVYWNNAYIAFSQLMGPSVPADVMTALTSYIAADEEAMAFIAGKPDPWGVTVNSAYTNISLPRADWPLADTWVAPAPEGCQTMQPIPWFSKVLAPVSDLHRIAQDMLSATPEAIYLHQIVQNTDVCRTFRQPTLPQGSRAMIGLITLADAERYALPVAALRTTGTGTGATFVAPTPQSLSAGAAMAVAPEPGAPFAPDAEALIASPTAYPGTMVLHAAFPLSGLDGAVAERAASFIQIATTEGQVQGTGSGQLPDGYLPITSTGSTAQLLAAAGAVATAVETQAGTMKPAPTPTPTPTVPVLPPAGSVQLPNGTSTLPVTGDGSGEPDPSPQQGLPAPTPSPTAAPPSAGSTPETTVSGPLKAAIPAGLGVMAAAGIAIPFVRRTPRGTP